LKYGAATYSDDLLAKIARIKEDFAASNPPAELVELLNPRVKTSRVAPIFGLTPGEAKWNLDRVTKSLQIIKEEVKRLETDKAMVTSATAGNSFNQRSTLPAGLANQLKRLPTPQEKLTVAKDYLNGLNKVLSFSQTKLEALTKELDEAEGLVFGAYTFNPERQKNLDMAKKLVRESSEFD